MTDALADTSTRYKSLRTNGPPSWALLLLLLAAIVIRARAQQSFLTNGLREDPDSYADVAATLVRERTFGTGGRVAMATPTASRAPLYPLLLAALRFPSDGVTSSFTYGAAQLIMSMATVVAVWRLARLWLLGPWPALLAAALIAVDPILLRYSTMIMTETLAALLAAVMLVATTHFARQGTWLSALTAGICAGLCILCRPEFLAWTALVAIVFPFAATGTRRLRRLALFVAMTAAVVSPWAIRNAREFGSPIITTTHGGITLLLANNPSFYEYLRSAPWGKTWDGQSINAYYGSLRRTHTQQLSLPGPRRTTVYQVDEVSVDREAYRQAFDNIRAEPGMFAYSCLVRVGRLWGVLPHATSDDEAPSRRGLRYAVGIFYAFELALAALGAWSLGRRLLAEPWVWGTLLLASYTLVHAFYWTDMRMRAPLVPVIALLVAAAVSRLAATRRGATSFPQAT